MSPEGGGDGEKPKPWKSNSEGVFECDEVVCTGGSSLANAKRSNDSDRRIKHAADFEDIDRDFAFRKLTRIANKGAEHGFKFASHNLKHFLGNTGNPVNVNRKFLLSDSSVLALIRSNINMIAGSKKFTDTSLKIGESMSRTVYYEDSADADALTDLYFGSGGYTIRTTVDVTIKRTGLITYEVSGTMTNHWSDLYDFHSGLGVYIPGEGMVPDEYGDALQNAGRARRFDMNSKWTTKFSDKFISYCGSMKHLEHVLISIGMRK